jgi:hypothetical protein
MKTDTAPSFYVLVVGTRAATAARAFLNIEEAQAMADRLREAGLLTRVISDGDTTTRR